MNIFKAPALIWNASRRFLTGFYTGTETRDPVMTDQHLQQYESYEIIRYFENIAPGRNGGGWVDTYSLRYLDRYAEQVWDTMFAKAREFTVFEWSAMTRPFEIGDRAAWENLPTSFNFSEMTNGVAAPTWARVAGYSLEQADKIVGQLGNPVGIASYRPSHSSGEDFLHNYFGIIGIPIDLRPEFPTNANLILLTECAKVDPDIVGENQRPVARGKIRRHHVRPAPRVAGQGHRGYRGNPLDGPEISRAPICRRFRRGKFFHARRRNERRRAVPRN